MISLPAADRAVLLTQKDYKVFIRAYYANNIQYTTIGETYLTENMTIEVSAGTSGFPLGCAVSKMLTFEVREDCTFAGTFVGKRVCPYLTYAVGEESKELFLGTFTAIEEVAEEGFHTIRAADEMMSADVKGLLSVGDMPADNTLDSLYTTVCNKLGLDRYETDTIRNGALELHISKYDGDYYEEWTGRQWLEYIALAAGGNAYITADDSVRIGLYQKQPTWNTVPAWYSLTQDAKDTKITGLNVEYKDVDDNNKVVKGTLPSGNSGYVLTLYNPLFFGRFYAMQYSNALASQLTGVTLRAIDAEFEPTPLVEFMDPIQYNDRSGSVHTSFITNLSYSPFDVTRLKNTSESAAPAAVTVSSGSGGVGVTTSATTVTVEVAETVTGAAGSTAAVENIGTDVNARLKFTIPRGATGAKGDTGAASTIDIENTASGTSLVITDSGGTRRVALEAYNTLHVTTEKTMQIKINATSAEIEYALQMSNSYIVLDVAQCVFMEADSGIQLPVVFQVLPKYGDATTRRICAYRIGTSTAPIDITVKVHEISYNSASIAAGGDTA